MSASVSTCNNSHTFIFNLLEKCFSFLLFILTHSYLSHTHSYLFNDFINFKKYLHYKFSSNQNKLKDKSEVHFFKLTYIGNLSHRIKNKLSNLCKEFCKENFNIKLVFSSFKIKKYFSYKDPIPNDLKSFLVYKFT